MTIHILKTIGTVWDAVKTGEKRFEVRRNDRFFQRGDTVRLRLIRSGLLRNDYWTRDRDPDSDLDFRIGWTLQGGQFGLEPGYVVFQLEPVEVAADGQTMGERR